MLGIPFQYYSGEFYYSHPTNCYKYNRFTLETGKILCAYFLFCFNMTVESDESECDRSAQDEVCVSSEDENDQSEADDREAISTSDGNRDIDDDDDDDDDDDNKKKIDVDAKTTNDDKTSATIITKKRKVHKLSMEKTTNFNEVLEKRGVIYIARIPPRMTPSKVKTILNDYGEVTRVYLQEEDSTVRKRRKKNGGSTSKRYTEGWVEMSDKKDAKHIVQTLHLQSISNDKRNVHYDDLWNIKYLSKFKWSHLTEKVAYERRVREQKIRMETLQARRETTNFKNLVETGKRLDFIELRRTKKKQRTSSSSSSSNNNNDGKLSSLSSSFVRQVQPMDDRFDKSSKSALLGSFVKK